MNSVKIVDLRSRFANCNDKLIEISDSFIYCAEEKVHDGHPGISVVEYSRTTNRERVLSEWPLPAAACMQHYFSFADDIIAVMESGGSSVRVIRIDKHTGAKRNNTALHLIGRFLDCVALDDSHLLFYTGPNNEYGRLFREYSKLTGFRHVACLYDIEEEKYYYTRDPRICTATAYRFIPYTRAGVPWLLILQPYGSAEDKQKAYRNRHWLGDNVADCIWECPLLGFLVSIKAGEERAPLEPVLCVNTTGLVRLVSEDAENFYFLARYFPTGDQRICACSKDTGKKAVVAKLAASPEDMPSWFSIDRYGGHAYRISKTDDGFHIKGLLNSTIDAVYPEGLGKFISCVDDRFLIIQYILADEKDSFEFNSIYDVETKKQKSYECRCIVRGENVILY